MPANRSPATAVRVPASPFLHALCALAFAGATAAAAQGVWSTTGALTSSDPVYRRPYLFQGQCYLSSVGTQVHFDVHELILESALPSDLTASLCSPQTGFDTVLYYYQHASPEGPFDPANPCLNLVAYNDDACGGAQSQIFNQPLAAGHVSVVLTSFGNGVEGTYFIVASTMTAQLSEFIFYSGLETGDTRSWSLTVP